MADIFVYDANTEDFDTLGLCGPLSPAKCVHVEEGNGKSELTIEHPIDAEGRWAYLTEGRIVKAEVPVRTVPPITDAGDLVTSIEVWSIKSGVRPHLYYKAKGGKIRKKKLASGLQVRIVLKAENRYKAAFTARKKVKRKWKTYVYYGWINRTALEYVTVESIPADPEAIEQVAPAWKVTDQLFRINATKLTDNGVTVSARHIWYDLLGNVTTYTGLNGNVNAPECLDALHGILDNCAIEHEFEGYTNIVGTRDTIEWTRISPVEALCDPEAGLLARWGAELVRDNTEFYVLAEAGMNRGVRIEYAKNLLGVNCDVDVTDVVTRIQPVGQTSKGKPLLLAAGTYTVDGQSITIDATRTVVSPRDGDHPTPHIMVLDVSDAKAKSTSATDVRNARVKMIRAALAKFAEDVDLPRVSLKVDFVALGDTEEYAQYQRLDDVFLYDRVRIWHPKIGVDVLTKVNRIEYDCLLERFNGIELGAVRRDWSRTQVSTWQLPSSIPGTLVAAGTLGAGAFTDDAGTALDLTQNPATWTVDIASSAGVTTVGVPTVPTTLSAQVVAGGTEIAGDLDAARFVWMRDSGDSVADSAWNSAHAAMKTVEVLAAERQTPARYTVHIMDEEYVQPVAAGSLYLYYTPASIERVTDYPEDPADGMMILIGNRIERWSLADNEWIVVTDYDKLTADLGTVQDVTTDNANFLGLLASAEYTESGLELSGPGGAFKQVLGPAAQEFFESGERTGGYWDSRYNAGTINVEHEIQLDGRPIMVKTSTGWMIP